MEARNEIESWPAMPSPHPHSTPEEHAASESVCLPRSPGHTGRNWPYFGQRNWPVTALTANAGGFLANTIPGIDVLVV